MAEGDPYRSDDLSELRALVRSALGRLTESVNAMPPSKLERLTKALAYFDEETPDPWPHPLHVLQALGDLTPEVPTGLAIQCSPMITLEPSDDGVGTAHYDVGDTVPPGQYLWAKALRIESDGVKAQDVEFWVKGGGVGITLIERCSITEFRKMTTFEGCAFGAVQPLTVHFEGPAGARVRVIVRADRASVGMGPYVGGGVAGVHVGPVCPKCHRFRGVFPGGCTCSTACGRVS